MGGRLYPAAYNAVESVLTEQERNYRNHGQNLSELVPFLSAFSHNSSVTFLVCVPVQPTVLQKNKTTI